MWTSKQDNGYRGVRVLVLGAAGFIGRWVARSLCAAHAHVYLAVRHAPAAQAIFSDYGVSGQVIEADLLAGDGVSGLLRLVRPSIVFNLAGYGVDPAERDATTAYQVNAYLLGHLCAALAETRDPAWQGQDIVHTGSALEYGSSGRDVSEDAVPMPTTLYGQSKLLGTRLLAAGCRQGVKGVTARLFTVYGPGEYAGRLLPSLLETARTGKLLALTAGLQERDFTYVEDVAEGLLRLGLVDEGSGGIVNLATGRLTSVRCFAETAASIMQVPADLLQFGSLPTRAEEMQHAPVPVQRLRRLIGWSPPASLAQGIRRTWQFEQKRRRSLAP